jgi:hypothetical protein
MTSRFPLSQFLIAAACIGSAPAAITLFAEYHLGESGSLGANNAPQDSSGNGRNYANSISGGSAGTGTSGVFAPGSTTYLDTTSGTNQGWYDANFATLPTDNFAFGIYVRAASNIAGTQGDVFTTGGGNGAYKLSLSPNGWAASAHNVTWIGPANGVAASFTNDIWVHLAIIRSGGTTTFYINGTAQGSVANAPVNGSSHLSVNPGGSAYFDGHLDLARVLTFDAGESSTNVMAALTAVPEPSTILLGVAGACLGLRRRSR